MIRDSDLRTTVIAHRGASAYAPEHTFAAYDLALEMRADYIELDLQMTIDGALIALHDSTVDRTTRCDSGPAGSGLARKKSLAEIKSFDAGSWFDVGAPGSPARYAGARIPTLDEVFGRYGKGANYYIEPKRPQMALGMEQELLRLMRRHGLTRRAEREQQVIIQSFSAGSLRKIHSINPKLTLVRLFRDLSGRHITNTLDRVKGYAMGIGPGQDVSAPWVEAAHDRDLFVHAYTVNSSAEMGRLIDLGVDGMFTDRPDALKALNLQAA